MNSKSRASSIDFSAITSPTYVVSAINDHIVPWESAYKTVDLVSGPVRFVLGSGGHIAGIVSPPGPQGVAHGRRERAEPPASAAAWRERAGKVSGSWWEDWARWSSETSGPLGKPPRVGSRKHKVLGPGPGQYVLT